MRYNLALVEPEQIIDEENATISLENMQPFAEWPLTAYGKPLPPSCSQTSMPSTWLQSWPSAMQVPILLPASCVSGVMDWIENPEEAQ